MNKKWLINKTPRSVDQLKLWAKNPRLNPENECIRLSDFAEDFTNEAPDKKEFLKLVKSITEDGFIPADPIVVWQNEHNKKYYVAEGNRRVVALKLLRNPEKSPQSIRPTIRKLSSKVNLADIEKIYVNVAPTFADAEWYISQRNSTSSLQRRWSSEQQRRWIVDLYEKHSGNIDKIISITKFTESELESTIRLLKIKDYIKFEEVKGRLTSDEYELAKSYRFPMTVLERFFNLTDARKSWGIEYDGIDVKIISNKDSFYNAFAELIKQIISKEITTRFTKDDLPKILEGLPLVSFDDDTSTTNSNETDVNEDEVEEDETPSPPTPTPTPNTEVRGNLKRKKLIPTICELNTSNHKLSELFSDLQKLPVSRYEHSVSVVLRVFFDMSIMEYIDSEGIKDNILERYSKTELRHVNLKKRLEYIKSNQGFNQDATRVIQKLLNSANTHSLDTLNGYVHGKNAHYSTREFLNGFWDFLYPLLEKLLDIRE